MPINTFVLNNDKAFSNGYCDNVSIENNTLILSHTEGRYIQSGCFTSPEYTTASFKSLVASWNCDTPASTAVQAQARVCVSGEWSQWFSYGKWSTLLCRQSQSIKAQKACMETDTITINDNLCADVFQIRIFLYTDDVSITPRVFLLAASVKLLREDAQQGAPMNRSLPVPAYSQAVRNPKIAGVMCSPTTITMLMNRYGEDVLPEQAAHACYDYAYMGFGNWSFSCALAGAFGYECYVAFTDIEGLKKEIKNGFACGVSVKYANSEENAAAKQLPYVQGTIGCTNGHLIVVRGFVEEGGTEYILVNDSFAENDAKAERKYLLCQFANSWNGVTYIFHPKREGAGKFAPARQCAELFASEHLHEYALHLHGVRKSLPVNFCTSDGACTGTVCYTVQNSFAYASAAHKTFYYTDISLNGNVILDMPYPANTKLTIYLVSGTGHTLTAELRM